MNTGSITSHQTTDSHSRHRRSQVSGHTAFLILLTVMLSDVPCSADSSVKGNPVHAGALPAAKEPPIEPVQIANDGPLEVSLLIWHQVAAKDVMKSQIACAMTGVAKGACTQALCSSCSACSTSECRSSAPESSSKCSSNNQHSSRCSSACTKLSACRNCSTCEACQPCTWQL